jgi:type IV pilus assembly protein PilM
MIFKKKKSNGRETAIGLDLGSNQAKAVVLNKGADGMQLQEYLVAPFAASSIKPGNEVQAGNAIAELLAKLHVTERRPFVAISCPSASIAETELPRMPLDEVRSVIRLNSQKYLRRDLSGACVDVCEFEDVGDAKSKKSNQMRLWVASAAREEVQCFRNCLVAAKAKPETIELSALTVINAVQHSLPAICEKEIVLLLDIGARVTSINILRQGQPVISRMMNFGGAQLTDYIAQVLSLQPADAEQEKRQMTETVTPLVQAQLFSLVREVQASIDFFERQQECRITKAVACGGTACSAKVLEFISQNVGIVLESLNPLANIKTDNAAGDAGALPAVAPSLAAAVGVAVAHLGGD